MNLRLLTTPAILISIFSVACSLIGSGGRELQMTSSPDVPGAQGVATVTTTDDGNTKIDLVVKHLAPPESVNSGATVYVVWVTDVESGAEAHNLGALKVDHDLNGKITAVTNMRSFELYVTAEPSQSSTMPTGNAVLKTNVAMKSVNEN